MIIRTLPLLIVLLVSPPHARAQDRLPIIDMHLHAVAADANGPPPLGICAPHDRYPVWDPAQSYDSVFMTWLKEPTCADPIWSPETDEEVMNQTIAAMERWNMFGMLSESPDRVATWRAGAPERFIPGIMVNPTITPDSVRLLVETGNVAVLGEISTQYVGIAPGDDFLAPYWALAEELDIPVGLHIGTGPPGVAALDRFPAADYRARLSSALTLEDALVRHPRLRVYIMHAGYPLLDDLLAVLYVHPQVHLDVSHIVWGLPRAEFYRYLGGIVDAGFSDRVMFGSDQMVWPGTIERAIAVIEEAPFLSEKQKRDIFYNNAARFLRLSEEEIADHHGK